MKILLVGNYAPDGQESMARFGAMMYSSLEQRGHQARLLCPRAALNRSAPLGSKAKWLGYLDKTALFAPTLWRAAREFDVVHICDHSNAFYTRGLSRVPHLVTCHDVLAIRSALGHFAGNRTGKSGRILQSWILRGLERAQLVVCDSHASREQLLQVSRRQPSSTSMIHVGLNYPYSPMPESQSRPLLRPLFERSGAPVLLLSPPEAHRVPALLEAAPFLLHIGSNAWYKNRLGLLRLYQELRLALPSAPRLVIAGARLASDALEFIGTHGLRPHVVEVGAVSNEELRALYSASAGLLFPSLFEGFGWPIIEAQACRCPVFASERAPLTEVGGEAAVYFDPEQPAQAASIVADYLRSPAKRQAMVLKGLANAQLFGAEEMCDRYIEVYKRLIDEGAPQKRRGRQVAA